MNLAVEVQSALQQLLPAGAAACVLPMGAVADPLFAQEETAMQKAVAKRRQEFALGRTAESMTRASATPSTLPQPKK